MSAADCMRRCKVKKNLSETQIYERLFLLLLKKTRLLELNHSEIVFIVDDDTVGIELTSLTGSLPQQVLLEAGTLRTYDGQDERRV